MPNSFFRFKQFTVHQDKCAMKVTTDGCLFGAWVAALLKNEKEARALDIGAGTGLLSLMVAQQSSVFIDAVELEPDAAKQAAQNIAASPWFERIVLHNCDILGYSATGYDFIFSNPPFYEGEIISKKEVRNIAHHNQGLLLDQLLAKAGELLTDSGSLFLLLPYKRLKEIYLLLTKSNWHIVQEVIVHPSSVHPPFRALLHVSKQTIAKTRKDVFFIKETDGQYAAHFVQLLKDYYLYL